MRVLHVSHQYPPAIGGSERYIADLSEELAARNHQVDVFTSRSRDFHTWRSELPGSESRQGVNIYRFRSMQRRPYVWRVLHLGLDHYWHRRRRIWEPLIFFGGGPLCPGMFTEILRRGRQYDLVHLNCLVYAHVAYGYWAARTLHLPVIVTPHAHAEQEVTYNIGYQRTVLAGSDHVLADTEAERAFLVDLPLDPQRVSLGGVGLRPAQYPRGDPSAARRALNLPEAAPVLLFLGRKDPYKGLPLVLQAFQVLRERHPDWHLVAMGPETDESKALWPTYENMPNLHVYGAVSDQEKLLALQACDCLVLPSVGEAFGIVYVEAWVLGKPVIGARTLAVSAVIDDEVDGLLATPGDCESLVGCVERMLADLAGARAMGARGYAKVLDRYTVPRIADRVERIYEHVLAKRGKRLGRNL